MKDLELFLRPNQLNISKISINSLSSNLISKPCIEVFPIVHNDGSKSLKSHLNVNYPWNKIANVEELIRGEIDLCLIEETKIEE